MRPVVVNMTVAESDETLNMTVEQNLEFVGNIVTYYTGSEAPASDLGRNGDIYVKLV